MANSSISSGDNLTDYAAFRLGFFSRCFEPEILNEVLPILCTGIAPNCFSGLQQAVVTLSQRYKKTQYPTIPKPADLTKASRVPGSVSYLWSLADRALPPSHERELYAFGVALGEYALGTLFPHLPPRDEEVWSRLRSLPKDTKERVPSLCSLAHWPRGKGSPDLASALHKIVQASNSQPKANEIIWPTGKEPIQPGQDNKQSAIYGYVEEVSRDLAAHTNNGQETGWDDATEARNKWIYDECCNGTTYKSIIYALKKSPEWYPIKTASGIKRSAREYAKRKGLQPPPERQPGRRTSQK